jgi:hypothetical protein
MDDMIGLNSQDHNLSVDGMISPNSQDHNLSVISHLTEYSTTTSFV